MQAIISIHDVEPATIGRVVNIVQRMPEVCRKHLVLLVIPGLKWSAEDIAQLKSWQEQGITLAGHGWSHRCARIRGVYHRLHSLLISRNAAEHLALTEKEIVDLLNNNFAWFKQNNLSPPDFYVPPAWAMGSIHKSVLRELPFRYYETNNGIFDAKENCIRALPLIGFEADTNFRKYALMCWNVLNIKLASVNRPLRISIHPYDNELKLAPQLWSSLAAVSEARDYRSIF